MVPTIADLTIPLKVNTDIAKINTLEELYHTLEADNAHRVSNHQENYTKHNTPGEDTAKCPTIKLGVLENYTPHQRETTVQGVQPPRLVRCMSPPHLISMSHPPVCMINSKFGWKSWISNCAPDFWMKGDIGKA